MIRDSFVFYRSFWEAIKELPDKDIADSIKAIAGYALDGVEPETPGIAKSIYVMAKPQIDANNRKYQNGSKGGRPITREEPNHNQREPKPKPKDNQIVTTPQPNVNDNENDNDKNDLLCARELFERLWKLYPVKKGKGQVSDNQKKRLYAVGEPALVKAIERYSTELQKDAQWRKPQNGSTFFNSGYVDYLDENFVPNSPAKESNRKTTGFSNFEQRDYDFDELERKLLESQ